MIKQFCLFYEDGINKHWFNSNKKFYFFWALNVLRSPSSRLIQEKKKKNQQQQLLFDTYFQELVFIWIVTIFNLDYTQSQNYIQSWNSSTLATSWEELTHWKRPWCWEGLWAGREGDDRGWDGWTASPTRWTWVLVNSRSWWWTGRPGMLRFMGSQGVGQDWATDLIWSDTQSQKIFVYATRMSNLKDMAFFTPIVKIW